MLLTYWLFHVIFTLPPTILLHGLLRPMLSSRDKFRLIFLVSTAVLYTYPWDYYIIKHKAWGYPHWSVLFKIGNVPVEEVFFFVIHTIFTTYVYTLFTIPIIPALYIMPKPGDLEYRAPAVWRLLRWGPSVALGALSVISWRACQPATPLFYFSAIGFWACPICAALWAFGGDHVLRRPRSVVAALVLPTAYLCFTDTVAIKHGTWYIARATSTGIMVVPHLPAEELAFFATANLILVLGLAAIEKFDAIKDTWPELVCAPGPATPAHQAHATIGFWRQFSLLLHTVSLGSRLERTLARAGPATAHRVDHLRRTLIVLRVASKSFYAASFIFPNFGAIRANFVILYGFCRETDDLIDNAPDKLEARRIVGVCKDFIELLWPTNGSEKQCREGVSQGALERFVAERVPVEAQPTFLVFSTMRQILRREPFDELISGYAYDSIEFAQKEIESEDDLLQYARWVAGSVGEMCVSVMWWAYGCPAEAEARAEILRAANDMGVALQLINIARDVKEDARMGRVYVPSSWFAGGVPGLAPADLNRLRTGAGLEQVPYQAIASKLLELASMYQGRSQGAIKRLPVAFQPGIRAATRVYMEIGEKIRAQFVSSPQAVVATCEKGASRHAGAKAWNGDRVFLSQAERIRVVVRELWRFAGN